MCVDKTAKRNQFSIITCTYAKAISTIRYDRYRHKGKCHSAWCCRVVLHIYGVFAAQTIQNKFFCEHRNAHRVLAAAVFSVVDVLKSSAVIK